MRVEEGHQLGPARVEAGPRRAAASSGKLIWMSAAVNSSPANHVLFAELAFHEVEVQLDLRLDERALRPCRRSRARSACTKNGIGAVSTRSKTSFSSSGGIAEPSA